MKKPHIPVLPAEVMKVLRPQAGEIYFDLTAGYGGHARLVLEKLGVNGQAWLFDQDESAIKALREQFADDKRVTIMQSNFAAIDFSSLPHPDMILLDLGVSSVQIDSPERGFAFQHNGPLDMRMDTSQSVSAYTLVNEYSAEDLADIFWRFGEERHSRTIARAIIQARSLHPITTTSELAEIIRGSSRGYTKIHPATRCFQALRIAVNHELEALETVLPKACQTLAPGGSLAVISFHSLEDRIIKHFMRDKTRDMCDTITGQPLQESEFTTVTTRPLTAAPEELDNNPRARSAKLRAVEKKQ